MRKIYYLFVIVVCIIGCRFFNARLEKLEDTFEDRYHEEFIMEEGIIEDISENTKRHRQSATTTYTAQININDKIYDVILTVNSNPENSIGDIVKCYGYNGKWYISKTALIRDNINDGPYFAGMLICIFIPIFGGIYLLIRRKKNVEKEELLG